jgi:hypothetical protein
VLSIPFQAPWVALSVSLRWAVPVIVGAVVLTGAAAGTAAVGWLATLSVASELAAITSKRICEPSSATLSV